MIARDVAPLHQLFPTQGLLMPSFVVFFPGLAVDLSQLLNVGSCEDGGEGIMTEASGEATGVEAHA
jgi:hypothetical protein